MAETTTVRETERKYCGEPVDADLAGALARAAAEATHRCAGPPREPAELALSAVYFDTEDLRLAPRGSRSGAGAGTDDGWHLKHPAGSGARDEVELAEHGVVEVLDRVEQALFAAGASRAQSWSKLGRVLAGRLPPPARRGAGKGAAAGDVVLAYVGGTPTRSG